MLFLITFAACTRNSFLITAYIELKTLSPSLLKTHLLNDA